MTSGARPDAGSIGGAPALLGVVLAGGKSSRMGIDKATLPHHRSDGQGNSTSYLQHAVDRLLPLVRCVAVVGRKTAASNAMGPGSQGVIALSDDSADQGPAMGVATALRYAAAHGFGAVLVTPVDMPDLQTEQLRQLVQAGALHASVVCASFGEEVAEPLLAIYPLSALAGIEQVLASPRRSLSQWLRDQPPRLVAMPRAASRNVNRPQDR